MFQFSLSHNKIPIRLLVDVQGNRTSNISVNNLPFACGFRFPRDSIRTLVTNSL